MENIQSEGLTGWPPGGNDPLFTRTESARYLGLKNRHTLSVWLCNGRYPELTPTRVGRRVFFRQSVLDAFLVAHTG
jgi:hypothetical protein